MSILLRWLFHALALLGIAYFIPGIDVSTFYIALVVALILGLVNTFIRPILLVLTLPINIITLGLFTLVINGVLFWFVASFVEGFNVAGFWTAVLGALILSILSWIINGLLKKD